MRRVHYRRTPKESDLIEPSKESPLRVLMRCPSPAGLCLITREGVTPVRAVRNASGYTLERLTQGSEPPIKLSQPHSGDSRWQLTDVATFVQWRDPHLMTLFRTTGSRTFFGIDSRRLQHREWLRSYLGYLRGRQEAHLSDLLSSIDPKALAQVGGPRSYIAQQARMTIADLEPGAPPDVEAHLHEYLDKIDRLLANAGTIWPPADDTYIFELMDRNWHNTDTITTKDGVFVTWVHYESGVLFPDPTCRGSHPPQAVAVPSSGELSVVCVQLMALADRHEDRRITYLEAQTYPAKQSVYPIFLLVDQHSEIVGMHLIGYMASEVFATPESTTRERDQLVRMNAAELAHQAE